MQLAQISLDADGAPWGVPRLFQPRSCAAERFFGALILAHPVPLSSAYPTARRRPPNILAAIGRLCEKCDGKCVICDSYVRPATLVRVCDECNYGSYAGRCVICGGIGVSDAYYCKECTLQEKDVSLGWCHCCCCSLQ